MAEAAVVVMVAVVVGISEAAPLAADAASAEVPAFPGAESPVAIRS
jgi:hypothetical protein